MSEADILTLQRDSAVFGQSFKPPLERNALSATYSVPYMEENVFTLPNKDILHLQKVLHEMRQHVEEILAADSDLEPELPEVFDLRPLSSRRVTVRILKDEAARFYFAAEDEVGLEDDRD